MTDRRNFILGCVGIAAFPSFGIDNDAYVETEFNRCKADIVYFASNHVTANKSKICLKDWQISYLKHLASEKDAVLNAYRQSGKTLMNSIYAIWKAAFHSNQKIIFVVPNAMISDMIFWNYFTDIIDNLPLWINSERKDYIASHNEIIFTNGSLILVTNENNVTVSFYDTNTVILDEFAFFKDQYCFLQDFVPIAGENNVKLLIISSTPNTYGDVFSRFVSCQELIDKTNQQHILFTVRNSVI